MRATPKVRITETAQMFGNFYGASAIINLSPEQIWRVTKTGGYYYAKRGTCKLRLTPTAFNKLFEIEEAQND